jgi:hypothetical protein
MNGGGLGIVSSSLTINDPTRGITIGTQGGTLSADTGLTLTVANAVAGGTGNLAKSGAGTVDLTGGATLGSFNVSSGTLRQSAGTVTAANLSSIGSGATYRLAGGKLRVDNLAITGTFDWGSGGALAHYTTVGSIGADNSSSGFQTVGVGTTLNVSGNLSTGDGAVLALHNSPTLYEQLGIRFNNLAITGDFSLNGVNDVLELEFNPYLLRPFSTTGTAAQEYGSLPLVTWTGADPTGTFDTVTGIQNDGRGFSLSTFAVTDGSALDINTYFLEYDAAANTLWFHYKVNGYVPEPGTFGLLAAGTGFIRLLRRLRDQRARLG